MRPRSLGRVSKNAWQNIGLAVLTVFVLAGAAWVVVKPYPGESWQPPRQAAATSRQPQQREPQATTAAFVGDSYVAGTGATRPSKRWSSQVAQQMGWKEINFGQAGTGYVNPGDSPDESALPQRVKSVIAAHPDVVVVSTGLNDVAGGYSKREVRTAVNQTYRRLRAGLPQARIVAVAPLWPDDSPPAKLTRISKAVKSAAARVDAEYVQTRPWYDDLSQRLAPDGLHPDNAGYRMLANKVSAALS